MLEVGCNVWFRRRTLPHTLLLPIAEFQLLSFLELGELGYTFVSIFVMTKTTQGDVLNYILICMCNYFIFYAPGLSLSNV